MSPKTRFARFILRAQRVNFPLGIVVMLLSLSVTHSDALYALGAVSAVSGLISLTLSGRLP